MTLEQRFDEPRDQFPVGMRVLAVDDDPTCLLLLETLLRRCQYHVTTTNQAVKALNMLRENKNMFDLVISDVHMPDMDGFKLLEHVGLEMDLPVIMLSTNGDHKLLMKGITHGACDYLLKPIRIEELKNIWQHVIRRKKFDSKDQNNSDKPHHGTGEGGHDSIGMGNSDQNGKLNKKRKDQNEDEDDERDENGLDNDDPSTQKKPQVVWSVELHRKFVAAVNQLGIDKAVPKRILELMNVDKLTRENVASHLQKYRLYLKRISCAATHNMVAAFGSTDPSYLRMGPLNGLGNFHTMAGSGQFQSAGFRSFPHSGMVGRLNTPAGLGIRGLPSPGMVQLGHAQHVSYPINDRGKFQPGLLPGNQGGSILQGMPMSLELDHLQNNRSVTNTGELSTTIDDSTLFPVSSGLPDTKITIGSSSDSLLGVPNNLFMLQGHPQETQSRGGFGNQSSVTVSSLSSEVSSRLPDLGRCNDNWPSAVQSSGIQSNSLPINDCFEQATLYTRSLRDNMSSMGPDIGSHSHDVSSIASAPTRLQDSRIDLQCQAAPISSNSARNMICTSQQIWENHKQDISHHPNLMCNSINSSIVAHGVVGPLGQSLEPKRTISPRNMDFNLIGQSNFVDPLSIQRNEVKRSAMESSVKLKQGYLMGQGKAQGSYTSNNFGSLEDLVSAMMKQGEPSCLEGCTSMGPWGGPGGSKFSFCVKGGIKQIVIAHGVAIDSIIFKGDNGDGVLEESNKFSGNGGSKTMIHIAWPKEYLTSISGSYESFYSGDLVIVTSLCFITNHTKYGPFGIHQGTSFSSTPMEGSGIIGFHGCAGQYFDAIGVYAKPMSECQKIEKPHSLEKLYILLLLLLVLVLMHKCSYYYQY